MVHFTYHLVDSFMIESGITYHLVDFPASIIYHKNPVFMWVNIPFLPWIRNGIAISSAEVIDLASFFLPGLFFAKIYKVNLCISNIYVMYINNIYNSI